MPAYTPSPENDWNPLRAHRNIPCPCGSQMKAKRCCGRFDVLPKATVKAVKDHLRALSARGVIRGSKEEIT